MKDTLYTPDMAALAAIAESATAVDERTADEMLSAPGREMSLREVASLLKAARDPVGSDIEELIRGRSELLRRRLFGNHVVTMAPVEIANTCASDCLFCGWRSSNRAMKRLKMPPDLVLLQVDYLVGLGIHYIELVSGDDIGVVRDTLPDLVRGTREIFERHGVNGKVNFCTLALTERQYAVLRDAGGDAMIVWQEAYDPEVYRKHIVAGPKHSGLDDNWKWSGDNGWLFRVQSQERAMRAGVEVALGTMLGVGDDMVTEFLAVVEHARVLRERYGATPEHPITIGMPIWNPITTPKTDRRPGGSMSAVDLFPTLAALYLLALPWDGIWVFPNCRVPLEVQIEAVRVAGAFTSTEVKLGPGGYLPALIRHARQQGEDTSQLCERVAELLREGGTGEAELALALDEREQFVHHYHEHRVYRDALERAGLQVVNGVRIPAGGTTVA